MANSVVMHMQCWGRFIYSSKGLVESSLMLRPTVSRPVCLGIKHPSGAYDQICITAREFRVCWFEAFSLSFRLGPHERTKWVRCNVRALQRTHFVRSRDPQPYNCWISPAQSFSGPSPLGLATIFCCLRFETSFSSSPTTRRVTVEVFDSASTREKGHVFPIFLYYPSVPAASTYIQGNLQVNWVRIRNFRLKKSFVTAS
jgi:hypothetical protein